jgi:hypothetical protein
MTALEIRPEEIGTGDIIARYREIKLRLWGKPQAAKRPARAQRPRVVPLPEIVPFRRRERRWEDARSVYLVPIGPCQHHIFLDHRFANNVALRRKTGTDILREVAEKHGLEVRDLLGPWRKLEIARARHEAVYRMREETSLSFPAIGRLMGGRDHTTAINSHKKFKALLAKGEVSL